MKDQLVLIVGGSSGIGRAVAEQVCQKGAKVVIASRNAEKSCVLLPQDMKNCITTCNLDITAPEDYPQLFETVRAIGSIDHLIIVVRPGITASPFCDVDVAEARKAFETKFWGPYQFVRAAGPYLKETASITLTSGIAGEKIYKGASTMSLINSTVETLCRILAVELSPVRVNAVSPGYVAPKPESVVKMAKAFPAKRVADLDEVATAYVALMENSYMTGVIMKVDGGASLI